MRLTGTAQRLTIIVGDSGHWHHKPLFTEIVHRASAAGLAGATVLHGVEGFGATSRIHTSRILSLSFLPQLDELVTEGLVILDDCEVIRYVGTNPDGVGGGHAPLDSSGRDR
jgi:uncharacterized protein